MTRAAANEPNDPRRAERTQQAIHAERANSCSQRRMSQVRRTKPIRSRRRTNPLGFVAKLSDKSTSMDIWANQVLWVCNFEWQKVKISGIAQLDFACSNKIGRFSNKANPLGFVAKPRFDAKPLMLNPI